MDAVALNLHTAARSGATPNREAAFPDGFAEAQQALLGTLVVRGEPTVLAYEELGAYKYLLRVALDGGIRDATVDAVAQLAEYDAQRGSQLVTTLEEFLRRHGNISATSEALFVHPNTLRQRRFLLFVGATACLQASHAAFYTFGTLHWRSMGHSDAAIGWLWAEGVLAEIVLFAFAQQIPARLGGTGLLLIAAIGGLLRWSITAGAEDYTLLVILQVLHAATFGAAHLGADL